MWTQIEVGRELMVIRSMGGRARLAPLAVTLTAAAIAGCGSSATPAKTVKQANSPSAAVSTSAANDVININAKTPNTKVVGIQGRVTAIQGTTVTVHGRLLGGTGNPTGGDVTRQVEVFADATRGMEVGDAVYLSSGPTGGFAEDNARDARNAGGSQSTSTSNLQPVSGPLTLASIKSCLTSAGAVIGGTKSLGTGAEALFAYLPSGTEVGIGHIPNATEAVTAESTIKSDGYSVSVVKTDPSFIVFFKGTAQSSDLAFVSKCTVS